jgi:microcystin-dependent protein
MTEPLTVNKNYTAANTGDLSGAWGTAALNANFVSLDGMLGGFATISLSSATTRSLGTTVGGGSVTPGAGPSESANSLIKFTGTLTGNAVIQFTYPGFYIIDNRCTVGSFYVQLAPVSGGGKAIGAPPGEKCHVFFDGTDLDYVDLGRVGEALDLHGVSAIPAWMGSACCSTMPYLIKDGSTYNIASYTALGNMLGSTFGGNGVTTFAVPDERSRFRLAVDTSTTGRVTNAISGVTGTTMGSSGGSQSMQSHNHTATVTDPGHNHNLPDASAVFAGSNAFPMGTSLGSTNKSGTASTGITVAVNGTGSGGSQNMPPCIVSFLPLVKT